MTKVAIDDSITIDQETLDDLITLARAQFSVAGDDDQFQYAHDTLLGISRFVCFIEKAARLYRLLGHDSLVELLDHAQVTAYQLDSVIRLLSCWDRESLFLYNGVNRPPTKAEELLDRLRGVLETHEVMKMDYEGDVYHLDLFPWGPGNYESGLTKDEYFVLKGTAYQPVDGRVYNTTRDMVAAFHPSTELSGSIIVKLSDEEDHATDSGAVGA